MKNTLKFKRYVLAATLVTAMTAVAGLLGEREIIFPEIAALAAGLWVVDKRVWHVTRTQAVWLMTLGAAAGICIVRFSPFPAAINIAMAFLFAGACLVATGTTLVPLISACMLPVLLGAESIVYPAAVFVMLVILTGGQTVMERRKMRRPVLRGRHERNPRRETLKWLEMLAVLILVAAIPLGMGWTYCILPPLIVTFVELSRPEAGLRKAPVLIFALVSAAAAIGAATQWTLHEQFGLPAAVSALVICTLLFGLFEITGRIFAPAGAVALIPLLIPAEDLPWYPLQAAAGAAVFIAAAVSVFRRPARSRAKAPETSVEEEPQQTS